MLNANSNRIFNFVILNINNHSDDKEIAAALIQDDNNKLIV